MSNQQSNHQKTRKNGSNLAALSLDSLEYYLEGFLLHQRAQRHAPATIVFYERYIRQFLRFLNEKSYPTDLAAITPNHLRSFLIFLQESTGAQWEGRVSRTGKPLKPRAVHAYARALRAFWNWATDEADLPQNPFAKVEMPKLPDAW